MDIIKPKLWKDDLFHSFGFLDGTIRRIEEVKEINVIEEIGTFEEEKDKRGHVMNMKIKRLSETATIPVRGSEQAAGYDLFADINEAVEVKPHETVKINSGVAIAVPEGYFGAIFARSGLSTKKGLRPANCTGVVDSDYRGPVIVALHNDSETTKVVEPQERIAQLVVMPYLAVEFEEVEELDETERGEGGFGSTGTK